ncbi:hypothetical protein [Mesorhizobium jarvisii]|uniref:antitoxin Xre/MbcA/ParS-like domain-containing protein n=1 Tax=Mesorhizobium jarvisii TaxID=1777867 RepID=UPI001F0AF1ED|nr:hypothetical protein [Mesorhizobium jarvisii]MCH4561037.1 hypothetical protein [Mesorhizobium jarvisii]
MTTRRRFSRRGNIVKQSNRQLLEDSLAAAVTKLISEHDPTIGKPALRVAAKLAGFIASSVAVQTQSVQRALPTVEDSLEPLARALVVQLVEQAQGRFDPRLSRFKAVPPPAPSHYPISLPADWAGPVAGPTVIERHFGIPRSTLFRWQKRDEAIALKTGSSRFVFPLKQFVDARPADGIAALIAVFGDHRSTWQWLMSPNEKFAATPPIDALLRGKVADVVAAAGLASEHGD